LKTASVAIALAILVGCARAPQEPPLFKVDPKTAGNVSGRITWEGKRPPNPLVDMSEDPACAEAHKRGAFDGPLVIGTNGALANAFVYIKHGLEGKRFAVPAAPVVIDQKGCWFEPRVLGIQTGQALNVSNSDAVTHNIHPLAQVNREWNHSQGPGDAPLTRRFRKPEVMVRVKCNIHSWMRAWVGAVEHPYFAVTAKDGRFRLPPLPPGEYTLAAWHEAGGEQEQKLTVPPTANIEVYFRFKGL